MAPRDEETSRIHELRKLLRAANQADYIRAEPVLTDREFDELMDAAAYKTLVDGLDG